MENPEKLATRR